MKYVKAIHYKNHEIKEILTDPGNRLLEMLMENGLEVEWSEEKVDCTLMRFDVAELDKAVTDDEEVLKIIDSMQTDKLITCTYCNAFMFNYLPYTYRDNHGCIGRSYECFDCRGLQMKYANEIAVIRKEKGQKEANVYISEIYV